MKREYDSDEFTTIGYFVHGVLNNFDAKPWTFDGQVKVVGELGPYAQNLNDIANDFLKRGYSFPGVFAYEVAEELAAIRFWEMASEEEGLPDLQKWREAVIEILAIWAEK